MRRIAKWIGIVLIAGFVGVQFVRPERNSAGAESSTDILTAFHPPQEVADILRTSCYDCHSNGTRYPWYAEVQPVGWWLTGHIQDGKKEVNFSEFGNYRLRRQYGKLREIGEQLEKNEMPLPSYLWIHNEAVLSGEQKDNLLSWVHAMRDSMKARYPIDSLERKRN